MRCSIASVALLLASTVSALPASGSRNVVDLQTREAGPSGYLVEPSGGTRYVEGERINFSYRRVVGKSEQTDSVDVHLKTYDEANPNDFLLATYLTYDSSLGLGADFINGTFIVPKLNGAENALEYEARLEVTERQIGNRNAAPFLAQAPQLWIVPKRDGPISPN